MTVAAPELSELLRAMAMPPRLLTELEAAAYTGRKRTSFRDAVAAGKLPPPSDRNGNRPLWDRRLLDRHIDGLSGLSEIANPWDES